ncbi:MAG: hypothetical protein Q4B63_07735 [Clostridium perfringens]|nr:hypothetical protein [Clostridium perfringens]
MGFMVMLNIIAGILSVYFGYEIRFNRKLGFINDYKNKHIVNKNAYLNWVGTSELVFGVLMLVVALGTIISKSNLFIVITDIMLAVIFGCSLLIGDGKYSR